MNRKQALRTEYLKKRRAVVQKAAKSESILEQLLQHPLYQSAQVIALYASLPEEVDTAGILRHALAQGKRVCLPKITAGQMRFYEITAHSAYRLGAFGIREPLSDTRINAREIELMVVPLVAADSENYRLGFGGGYYDMYLCAYTGATIGICFREQLSPVPLPHEAHDIPLNEIITD